MKTLETIAALIAADVASYRETCRAMQSNVKTLETVYSETITTETKTEGKEVKTMKKYNLSRLMKKAWSLYRQAAKKAAVTFSEALKAAWVWIRVQAANTAKIEAVAEALGIVEEFHSWAGWKSLGRQVIHTEEAVFKVEVADPTTKKGTRIKNFFLYSQTQPTPIQ